MPAIFLSYRRDDSEGYAGRLYESLTSGLEGWRVFIDVDDIAPGADFVAALDRTLSESNVLLALIGRNWLTATDQLGARRLENPNDFVRLEISRALASHTRVIPVLIQDARMPCEADLPDDLKGLARRQAVEIRHTRWADDVRRLVAVIDDKTPADRTRESRGIPPQGAARAPSRRAAIPRSVALAVALVLIGAAGIAFRFAPAWFRLSEPVLAFNARDWIIITDCDNLTGDAVFDRSLSAALDVGIGQSNYVNVYSRDRLQAALQRMRKKLSGPVDLALASEVAQRDNVRAVLTCSIGKVGDAYTLAGRIVDPRTQRIALTESVEASGKTQVLTALDQLAGRLRRRLGESIGTLSSQQVPLPQATTSSLEALKMFTESQRVDKQDARASEQLLLQAIELDPEFAMAHAVLGHHYLLASEPDIRRAGDEHLAKALSLSNRLTTRERLLIVAAADDARGNREQAAVEYRSYLSQYPDDTRVWFRLGWTYMAGLGQPEDAIDAFNRVIAIDPRDDSSLINLATCYGILRQFERAVETYHKAFALDPNDIFGIFINGEYGAALMQTGRLDDAQAAFEKMAASKDSVSRARGLRSLAFLSMYRGRHGAAMKHLRESIPLNQANGAIVSVYRDRMILAHALLATGRAAEARQELSAIDAIVNKDAFGPEWLVTLVKTYARLGNLRDATRTAALIRASLGNVAAASSANRNTARDQAFLDIAQAEIAVAQNNAAEGVSLAIQAASRLQRERSTALDTLAFATAAAGKTQEAVAKYEELLSQPWLGSEAQEEWFDAHLALGRLYEQIGRRADAVRLYERVSTTWKDGDADLVLLKTARTRLAALSH